MIQTLHIQNFKCFEDTLVEFGTLTLLAGLNGQGKSTVLQSLLLLRQSYQQGLLPQTGLALNGDLVSIGTAQDALFEWAAEDPEIGIGIRWVDGQAGDWSFAYNQEADVLDLTSTPVEADIFATSLFDDNFQYLQAERIGPRTSFATSDFSVRQHRQLGTQGEYTAHFLTIFDDHTLSEEALVHPKAVSNSLQNQAEAWMSEV